MTRERANLLKNLLDEFNSKLDWEDQSNCDVNTGMPLLTGGTHKQVRWACELRYKQVANWTTLAEEFPEMLSRYSDEQLIKIFRELLWQSDAIWWINNREKHLTELA